MANVLRGSYSYLLSASISSIDAFVSVLVMMIMMVNREEGVRSEVSDEADFLELTVYLNV